MSNHIRRRVYDIQKAAGSLEVFRTFYSLQLVLHSSTKAITKAEYTAEHFPRRRNKTLRRKDRLETQGKRKRYIKADAQEEAKHC